MSTENRPTQGTPPPSAATAPGAGAPPAKEKRDLGEIARLVGLAIVVALLIAFIVENSGEVTVHFVFFTAHVSLIWALILAAVLGALADRLVPMYRRRRKARKAKQAQQAQQAQQPAR
jgi:uncharacterized integral membrane protein